MRKCILLLIILFIVSGCIVEAPEVVEVPEEAEETIENKNLSLMNQVIQSAVEAGFPGGQLVILYQGEVIASEVYGYTNRYNEDLTLMDNPTLITEDTLYDLASVTKMLATNYLLQHLVYEGKLQVTQKISDFFDEFKEGSKSELTIQDLLSHQAGFCADPQFHNEKYKGCVGQAGDNPYFSQERETTLKEMLSIPQITTARGKQVYSDLDYMILGQIIEKVTGYRLDEAFNELIAKPMGLTHTTFNPLENGFKSEDCAATELRGNTREGTVSFNKVRKSTVQGEVQDEKTYYSMNGISGHAGLFSNATEVAKLMQLMTQDNFLFDEKTIDLFLTPIGKSDTFALGWRKQGQGNYSGIFSTYASSSSFGHSGWTGTLVFCDPEVELIVVWLSNKVNTPLVDAKKNSNDFEGNHYTEVAYRSIISMSYALIHEDDTQMKKVIQEMMDENNIERLNEILLGDKK